MKKMLIIMLTTVLIFATPMTALATETTGEGVENEGQAESFDDTSDDYDIVPEGDENNDFVEAEIINEEVVDEDVMDDDFDSDEEVATSPTESPEDEAVDEETTEDVEFIEDMKSRAKTAEIQRSKNNEYNIVDYGANGRDNKSDSDAIRAILNLNKNKNINDKSNTIVVIIPAGTYYLDRVLEIYSNTIIRADKNAKIIRRKANSKMLLGRGRNNGLVGGYNCFKNITIEGGIWDGDDLKGKHHDGLALFRHGQNMTFRNMTFIHCADHFLNISASKNVLIEGVTFKNAVEYTGTDKKFWINKTKATRFNGIEAIHMDTAASPGESSALPLDNTAAANITVRNCTFDKVYSGVGNHNIKKGRPTKNVVIENNTFKNLLHAPVIAWGFENLTVRNNTAINVNAFLEANDSTGKIVNNSVKGKASRFVKGTKLKDISRIQLYDGSSFTISNNVIEGGRVSGIALFIGAGKTKKCTATISNNTINGVANNGIYAKEAKNTKIINNKVTNSNNHGIIVRDSRKTTVKNNTVTKSGNCGIYIDACKTANVEANVIKKSKSSGLVVSNSLASKKVSTKITLKKNKISGSKNKWDISIQNKSSGTMKANTVDSLSRINIGAGCKFKSSGNVAKRIFTVKYNASGGKGKMPKRTVTYGKKTLLRANIFTKKGKVFAGWNASRKSDKKWAYAKGKKTAWYKKGKQPAGYKLKVYKNKANVAKITKASKDVVTMKAVWK